MAFDFPNSPTSGQTVNGPGGTQYRWDGTKFVAQSPTGSSMWVPDAAAPWIGPTLTGYLTPAADPRGNYAQFAARRYSTPVDAAGHNWDGGVVQVFGPAFSSDGTTTSPQAGGVGIGTGSNATGTVYYWDFWPDGTATFPGHLTVPGIQSSNGRVVSGASSMPTVSLWSSDNNIALGLMLGGVGDNQLYIANMNGAGDYAGTTYAYWDTAGNYTVTGNIYTPNNLTCNTLNVSFDSFTHNIYCDGSVGIMYRNFSGYWTAFGWNGRVQFWFNGGYVELRDTRDYTPNQNVDYASGPTFGTTYVDAINFRQWNSHVFEFNWDGRVYCSVDRGGAMVHFHHDGQDCYVMNLYGQGKNVSSYGVQAQSFSGDTTGFWYNGSLVVRWNNSWDQVCYMQSDARLKAEIAPTEFDCLDAILRVPVRQFRWRDMSPRRRQPGFNPGEARGALHRVGIIAQELAEIAPEFAAQPDNNDESDPEYEKQIVHLYGVDHFSVIAALCGAVQKLNERLEAGGL